MKRFSWLAVASASVAVTTWVSASVDRKLEDAMAQYWVNFAATGDPNGKGLPVWPLIKDRATGRAMLLGEKIEAQSSSDSARLSFFDQAYARLWSGN
jgi:para-nitrobenzyl esterase